MKVKYNHALSLLAMAVHAHRSGEPELAAKAFSQAATHKSVADVLETAAYQLKARKKAALAAKAAKPTAAHYALSRMAKEIAAIETLATDSEDADKPGEDLRIEVDDEKVAMAEAEDDEDSDDDDDDDEGEAEEASARFAKTLSNLQRAAGK